MNPEILDNPAQAGSPHHHGPDGLVLPVLQAELTLCCTRGGELLPWIGPALRGLVAGRFKADMCRHSTTDRDTHWKHCTGCPHLADCPYGLTFESGPAHGSGSIGQEEGLRPVAIAPAFPAPPRIAAGMPLPVRVTCIGRRAVDAFAPLTAALDEAAGAAGIGPDHVRFAVAGTICPPLPTPLRSADLPDFDGAGGARLPEVVVELTSPLFLTRPDASGRRRPVWVPAFADLLRAALRTVGRAFREHAGPLPADFAALKAGAEAVRLESHNYEPFRQRRWSNRTEQRYDMEGTIGCGAYRDVPLALVPWLTWGGRLHTGTHRVAGAGGWRVTLA